MTLQRLRIALAVAFGLSCLAVAQEPRVLLIDLDDVGYDLLADSPTPNLDAIAARGRFYSAFTANPLCAPTRAVLHTGAYASHPDLLFGANPIGSQLYRLPIAPLVPLPAALEAAGVSTAKIGKWHLATRNFPTHPQDVGYSEYAGAITNLAETNGSYTAYLKVVNGVESFVIGRYLTTDETDDAILRVQAGVRFVSVSYHAPHSPWHTPPSALHSIAPILDNRDRARAMLEACDRELGRLVQAALARDYTVIIFSDNGTAQPIGGFKGTLLDGGIRVPLWAIGPGVEQGLDETPIGVVDLYATICEIFGVGAGPPHRGPHSRSFLRSLGGFPRARRWTYSERFRFLGADPRLAPANWQRAVRGERWKLTQLPAGESFFDLELDPLEQNNLLLAPSLPLGAQPVLDHFRLVLHRL